jgi:hypothetical protein
VGRVVLGSNLDHLHHAALLVAEDVAVPDERPVKSSKRAPMVIEPPPVDTRTVSS